jgi:predicted DNA-binding WGR domain protein
MGTLTSSRVLTAWIGKRPWDGEADWVPARRSIDGQLEKDCEQKLLAPKPGPRLEKATQNARVFHRRVFPLAVGSPRNAKSKGEIMRKFVYVGPNRLRARGISSKGWTIARRGTKAFLRWGSIEVIGGSGGKYRWHHEPQEKIKTFSSKAAADEYVKVRIAEKETKHYKELPWRVPIKPPPSEDGQPVGKVLVAVGGVAAIAAAWRWFNGDDGAEGESGPHAANVGDMCTAGARIGPR